MLRHTPLFETYEKYVTNEWNFKKMSILKIMFMIFIEECITINQVFLLDNLGFG